MSAPLAFSDPVRINQIGKGLTRTLEPDADAVRRIARELDLQKLENFTADVTLEPAMIGWRLSGRIRAHAVQTCGLSLEPMPVDIDRTFVITLSDAPPEADSEIEVTIDDDAPDVIEDGKVDLGQYAVEQLALSLDPFPRKPGATFVQPEEPGEISPFGVLKDFKAKGEDGEG